MTIAQERYFRIDLNIINTFKIIKNSVCKANTLTVFDLAKELTLEVNASQKGLGACLLQEDTPISFASKSLTKAKQKYPNTEHEYLTVVFGLEHFKQFVYCRPVSIRSDHHLLEVIFTKPITTQVPLRLQRCLESAYMM